MALVGIFKVDGQGVRGGTFSGCRFSLLMVVKMAMTEMLVVVKKEAKMEMVLVGDSSTHPLHLGLQKRIFAEKVGFKADF